MLDIEECGKVQVLGTYSRSKERLDSRRPALGGCCVPVGSP